MIEKSSTGETPRLLRGTLGTITHLDSERNPGLASSYGIRADLEICYDDGHINIIHQERIMTTGVYGIFDLDTDECLYVGQSIDVTYRIRVHASKLRNGKHRLPEFQEEWNRGVLMYSMLLEECENTDDAKNMTEIKWFNILLPKHYGQCPSMNNKWRHSDKSRKNITKGGLSSIKNVDRHSPCETCGNPSRKDKRTCYRCSAEEKRVKKILGESADNTGINTIDMFVRIRHLRKVNPLVSKMIVLLGESGEKERVSETYHRDNQIRQGYEEGYSLRDLSRRHGVSHICVRNVLISMNVPLRDQKERSQKYMDMHGAQVLEDRECEYCGDLFPPRCAISKTCSKTCEHRLRTKTRESNRVANRVEKKKYDDALICAEYESGEKITTIGKKYDISRPTIYKILDENNIPRPTRRRSTP